LDDHTAAVYILLIPLFQ